MNLLYPRAGVPITSFEKQQLESVLPFRFRPLSLFLAAVASPDPPQTPPLASPSLSPIATNTRPLSINFRVGGPSLSHSAKQDV